MLTFDIFERDSEAWDVYELLVEMHKDSPFSQYPLNEEHLFNMILSFRERDKVIFLLRSEDKIVGYLAASSSQHPLFPDLKMASEHGWYVKPEHRKEASWSLVDAYEEWARVVGCKICLVTNWNVPKLSELYLSRGYKNIEQSFLKELN